MRARRTRGPWRHLAVIAMCGVALVWAIPFLWMLIASIRPEGATDIASLTPPGPFDLQNYRDAWDSGDFPQWYLNTIIMCGGILLVQCVTISLAGYAFARLRFPGRDI